MHTMRMNAAVAVALALGMAAIIIPAQGCIFEFSGGLGRQLLQTTEYNHAYAGLDWPNDFATCAGQKQSPVMLPKPGLSSLPLGVRSSFSYNRATSNNAIEVVNNGHTVQVNMPANLVSDVKIPIYGDISTASHLSVLTASLLSVLRTSYVKASPAQMHFHTRSEHLIDGASYPLELHIVHFISPSDLPYCQRFVPMGLTGCPVVLGVMLKETDNPNQANPALDAIWQAMPLNKGETNTMPGASVLDLEALLPRDRSYFTYEGSLTTPPCTEGLLWHVMKDPIYITQAQLMKFREAVAETSCPVTAAGRRLMQGSIGGFNLPDADAAGCRKLGNGVNFRELQPLNGRVIQQS